MNAGEVHDFVYDGSAWNDVTASVIFRGSNSNGNYVKHRDGLIEQWLDVTTTSNGVKRSYPLPFTSRCFTTGSWITTDTPGDAGNNIWTFGLTSVTLGYNGRWIIHAIGY